MGRSRSGPQRACAAAGPRRRGRRLEDVLEADLDALAAGRRPGSGDPVTDPVFLVCTHGKVDACCAQFGQPAAQAVQAAEYHVRRQDGLTAMDALTLVARRRLADGSDRQWIPEAYRLAGLERAAVARTHAERRPGTRRPR